LDIWKKIPLELKNSSFPKFKQMLKNLYLELKTLKLFTKENLLE